MSGATTHRTRGLALIELLIASALAALLLGALATLARDGMEVGRATRSSHELLFQARFALGQVVARAEAATPRPLTPPSPGTSGDWFGTTMYCLRSTTAELIESTPADTGCTTGTRIIGERISAFSVAQPAGDPLDRPQALITLTASDAAGAQSVTLSAVARLGGGTR